MDPNLIWVATLLGGCLGGFLLAIWNVRLVKPGRPALVAAYAVAGIGGFLLSIFLLAHLTAPQGTLGFLGPGGQPGFGIPTVLALSFLLVSIPYNRDRLAVLQWIWSHPIRKLVLNLGGARRGLAYAPFASAQGELFAEANEAAAPLAVPLVPLVVTVISLIIGIITLILGNVFVAS